MIYYKTKEEIALMRESALMVSSTLAEAGYPNIDVESWFGLFAPAKTDPANLERPCGRGLLLMRTFMDEVNYNDKGNRVEMIKRATNVPHSRAISIEA